MENGQAGLIRFPLSDWTQREKFNTKEVDADMSIFDSYFNDGQHGYLVETFGEKGTLAKFPLNAWNDKSKWQAVSLVNDGPQLNGRPNWKLKRFARSNGAFY